MMTERTAWPAIYERELVPAIFGPWSLITVSTAALQSDECVLDVACGTGVVTRKVAECINERGRVVGLDINADMLEFARSQPIRSGTPVEWVQGDAQAMPFANGTFDVALCQGGLQFMHDRLAALREMYRVLQADGRLVVLLYEDLQASSGFAILARTIAPYVDPKVVEHIVAPFMLNDKKEVQALFKEVGFVRISLSEETKITRFRSAEYFVRSRLLGSRIRSLLDDQTLERAIREGSAALREYEVDGELRFPMHGYLLLAYKR